MFRDVGMTPVLGLTPLKLTVYARNFTRNFFKVFCLQKYVVLLSKIGSLAKFHVQGRRHDASRGLTTQKLTIYSGALTIIL